MNKRFHRSNKVRHGFSLAEILICLALLGVLSAFTIPYMTRSTLSNQSDKYTRIARDTAMMTLTAFEKMRINTPPSTTLNGKSYWDFSLHSLTPYLNYVAADTTSMVDSTSAGNANGYNSGNASQCGSSYAGTIICYRLHNGAILWGNSGNHATAGGDGTGMWFYIDPDGSSYTNSSTGAGKSLLIWLLSNGKMYSSATLPGTVIGGFIFGTYTYTPGTDPDWFQGF